MHQFLNRFYYEVRFNSSWDWIKVSSIITTITGTVGIEAVHHKKPVISFGAHQALIYCQLYSITPQQIKTTN